MKRTILGLLAAIAVTPLLAATYYVRSSGSSPAEPYGSWETAASDIATAVAAATSKNDTILVAPGTYHVSSTIVVSDQDLRKNLKIKSADMATGEEDPENTILDGGGTTAIIELNTQYASVSGFTFANGYKHSDSYNYAVAGGAAVRMGANGVSVSNCIFRANRSVNLIGTCIYGISIIESRIADCVFNCNTQEVTVADSLVRGSAIYLSAAASEKYYSKISGCKFSDNVGSGPRAQGSTVCLPGGCTVIDNCNFLTNYFTQTEVKSNEGTFMYFGDNTTMKNSYISSIAYANKLGGQHGGSLMRVMAGFACSDCRFNSIEEQAGSMMYGTISISGDSASFTRCEFTGNALNGRGLLWLHNKGDLLLRNCLFRGNTQSFGAQFGIIGQINSTGTTGISVENSTFVDNTAGVTFRFEGTSTGVNYLSNSIFTTPVSAGVTTVASNCCMTALLNGPNDSGNFTVESVGGLSGLKFVDAANGDYRLQERSPLREAGTMLSWMTSDATDLDGNLRVVSKYGKPLSRDPSGLPDIGCYECTIALIPGLAIFIR